MAPEQMRAVDRYALRFFPTLGTRSPFPSSQPASAACAPVSASTSSASVMAPRTMLRFLAARSREAPSGRCAGRIHRHYPDLFEDEPPLARRARALVPPVRET